MTPVVHALGLVPDSSDHHQDVAQKEPRFWKHFASMLRRASTSADQRVRPLQRLLRPAGGTDVDLGRGLPREQP